MTTYLASMASRQLLGKSSHLLMAATVATSSLQWVNCESSPPKTVNLKPRMTSMGRFSLQSETLENPSVPTLFLLFKGRFTKSDFVNTWNKQNMEDLHPRFACKLDKDKKQLEKSEPFQVESCVRETTFPISRYDLQCRLQSMLMTPILKVQESLWKAYIATSSSHSLLLFQSHHCLGDGVSLTSAFLDLADEASEIRDTVRDVLRKRSAKTLWERLQNLVQKLLWLFFGSIQATWYHLQLHVRARLHSNAFWELQQQLEPPHKRTVSWCPAAPVDEVQKVAKAMGKHVTINDVMVSCITAAIARQLKQHRQHRQSATTSPGEPQKDALSRMEYCNIVIPVHLQGGVLLPHQSLSNRIGALCARLPCEADFETRADRVQNVHSTLYALKRTPMALLSHGLARASTLLPSSWTRYLFQHASGQSVAVVTNARGPPQPIHLGGTKVEASFGFLPLPPGIPIGLTVASYGGSLNLSIYAEEWAVPDADEFLQWVVEEYHALRKQVLVE